MSELNHCEISEETKELIQDKIGKALLKMDNETIKKIVKRLKIGEIDQSLHNKRDNAYRKIIFALLDALGRDTCSYTTMEWLKTEIGHFGLNAEEEIFKILWQRLQRVSPISMPK